jgi:hypothetical protein
MLGVCREYTSPWSTYFPNARDFIDKGNNLIEKGTYSGDVIKVGKSEVACFYVAQCIAIDEKSEVSVTGMVVSVVACETVGWNEK